MSALKEYLNATKKEKVSIGIGGFTADVRMNEQIELTSDAPDNYVEDGSVLQDHIINDPVVITIEGEVSDIHIKPEFISDIVVKPIDKAQDILNNVFPFSLTYQATQKIKKISLNFNDALITLDSYIQRAQNLASLFEQNGDESNQSVFFKMLNEFYYSKKLMKIETPFGIYENMRIVNLTIIRDNKTQQALKYKLTAKQIRIAKTEFVLKEKYFKNPTKSVSRKTQSKKSLGILQGTTIDKGILYMLFF